MTATVHAAATTRGRAALRRRRTRAHRPGPSCTSAVVRCTAEPRRVHAPSPHLRTRARHRRLRLLPWGRRRPRPAPAALRRRRALHARPDDESGALVFELLEQFRVESLVDAAPDRDGRQPSASVRGVDRRVPRLRSDRDRHRPAAVRRRADRPDSRDRRPAGRDDRGPHRSHPLRTGPAHRQRPRQAPVTAPRPAGIRRTRPTHCRGGRADWSSTRPRRGTAPPRPRSREIRFSLALDESADPASDDTGSSARGSRTIGSPGPDYRVFTRAWDRELPMSRLTRRRAAA